jgi:hypothetical protein
MLGLSHSVEVALGVSSIAMFVGSLVAVPVFIVKVPDDYFARPPRARSLLVTGFRTLLGLSLIALGIAMIVLPGQGVLTILVGLSVLELPVKHRMIRRLLGSPKVRHAIDAMRHKAGKGSLIVPAAPPDRVSSAASA